MKNIHSLFVALLLFVSIASGAQISSPRADARQHAQRKRIAVGRHDGELTRREATYLHREQRHIHMSERRAEADGKVTRREKVRLERKQDRASRHVRRAKHNQIDRKE